MMDPATNRNKNLLEYEDFESPSSTSKVAQGSKSSTYGLAVISFFLGSSDLLLEELLFFRGSKDLLLELRGSTDRLLEDLGDLGELVTMSSPPPRELLRDGLLMMPVT